MYNTSITSGSSSSSDVDFSPVKELFLDSIPTYIGALIIFLFFLALAFIVPFIISFCARRYFSIGVRHQRISASHIKGPRRQRPWYQCSHWDPSPGGNHFCDHDSIITISPLRSGHIANNIIELFYFIIQITIIIIGIVVSLDIIGVHLLILLVPLGIWTFIFTIGCKDTFTNVFACLDILTEDLVDIDDFIEIGSCKMQVIRIGPTHILAESVDVYYSVPNSAIANGLVKIFKNNLKLEGTISKSTATTSTGSCTCKSCRKTS